MKIKILLILLLHISTLTNLTSQDSVFRRIRDLQPSLLIQDFTPSLIALLTEKFREFDGIEVLRNYQNCEELILSLREHSGYPSSQFKTTVQKAWKAVLRIGFNLAIIKDIEDLELKKLDISQWIEENLPQLLEIVPELKNLSEIIQNDSLLVKKILENFKKINFDELRFVYSCKASLRYDGFKKAIINYYFLNFVANATATNVTALPESDRDCEEWLFKEILDLHRYRISSPQFVPPNYCPDLFLIGELDAQKRKEEIDKYLLGNLLRFYLSGYAQCLIGEREKMSSFWDESAFLKQLKSGKFNSEIKRFTEEHFPQIRRIVWSAFNFRTHFTDGQPLINTLTISLAEDLVRKIISLYFRNYQELRKSPAYTLSDPFYYLNRNKDRYAYEAWNEIKKKIETIKMESKNPEHCKKIIVQYLFKILAISGTFDFSIDEIRSEKLDTTIRETSDPKKSPFTLRSFNKFFKEVLFNTKEKIKLVIFADNHGEIVYLLGLIQYLIEEVNPNLYVYLVPRGIPVADDVSYGGVSRILFEDDPEINEEGRNYFGFLREQHEIYDDYSLEKRFYLVPNGPDIQGVVLNVLSPSVIDALSGTYIGRDKRGKRVFYDRIVLLSIGNANFVSTQGLDVQSRVPFDRYYLFRVKAERVSEMTDIPVALPFPHVKYPLVFAYVEPGVCIGTSFGGRKYQTLSDYNCHHPEYFDPLTPDFKIKK